MAEHYYYSIASGSSGNCGLYMADGTAILIDLGVSLRRITTALKALSLTLEDISAVVLTHEHIDHVKGLPMFLKKAKAPVFATRGTAEAFEEKNPEYADRLNIFDSGERFWVRDVDVVPFPRRMTQPRARATYSSTAAAVRLCDRPWLCAARCGRASARL